MFIGSFFPIIFLLIVLSVVIGAFFVKKHIINIIENSKKLEEEQIKSSVAIVNIVFYVILAGFVVMFVLPMILAFLSF